MSFQEIKLSSLELEEMRLKINSGKLVHQYSIRQMAQVSYKPKIKVQEITMMRIKRLSPDIKKFKRKKRSKRVKEKVRPKQGREKVKMRESLNRLNRTLMRPQTMNKIPSPPNLMRMALRPILK